MRSIVIWLLCVIFFTGCEQLIPSTDQKLVDSVDSIEGVNSALVILDKQFPELTNKQKLAIEELSKEDKLGLLSLEAMEVVNRYFKIEALGKNLSNFKDNYVELNEEEEILINELEEFNKLSLLSNEAQEIWSNYKIIKENLPTSVNRSWIKSLNSILSSEDIYSKLPEAELQLIEELNTANKLYLLTNVNAREVAKTGLEVNNLDNVLALSNSDSREYPELDNEEKRLLRDIESKNKLSSLSKVAQDIWIRSKLLEGLPTGVNITQLKNLNDDLQKLANTKITDFTQEQMRIIELLNKYGKLELLTSSISKDVAANYMLTMNQVRVVESYLSNNREALESNNSQKVKDLLNILRDSNLIIDRDNIDKPLFSLMKVRDKGIYKEKNPNAKYRIQVESGKYFPFFDKGYFWLIDDEGKIRNGDNPALCLGIDLSSHTYLMDCSSEKWQGQLTFDILGTKDKVKLRNKDGKCLDISNNNIIGDINTCNDINNNISGINQLDKSDLIWALVNKEDKNTLLKVIRDRDLGLPEGVTEADYWHLDSQSYKVDLGHKSSLDRTSYNIFKKLEAANKLYLLSPWDIKRITNYINRGIKLTVYSTAGYVVDLGKLKYNTLPNGKEFEFLKVHGDSLLSAGYPVTAYIPFNHTNVHFYMQIVAGTNFTIDIGTMEDEQTWKIWGTTWFPGWANVTN